MSSTTSGMEKNRICILTREKGVPPILIMHGDRDQLVPFNQSVRLYNKLRETGKEAEVYKPEGASHGMGGFNSKEARQTVIDFIESIFDNAYPL